MKSMRRSGLNSEPLPDKHADLRVDIVALWLKLVDQSLDTHPHPSTRMLALVTIPLTHLDANHHGGQNVSVDRE